MYRSRARKKRPKQTTREREQESMQQFIQQMGKKREEELDAMQRDHMELMDASERREKDLRTQLQVEQQIGLQLRERSSQQEGKIGDLHRALKRQEHKQSKDIAKMQDQMEQWQFTSAEAVRVAKEKEAEIAELKEQIDCMQRRLDYAQIHMAQSFLPRNGIVDPDVPAAEVFHLPLLPSPRSPERPGPGDTTLSWTQTATSRPPEHLGEGMQIMGIGTIASTSGSSLSTHSPRMVLAPLTAATPTATPRPPPGNAADGNAKPHRPPPLLGSGEPFQRKRGSFQGFNPNLAPGRSPSPSSWITGHFRSSGPDRFPDPTSLTMEFSSPPVSPPVTSSDSNPNALQSPTDTTNGTGAAPLPPHLGATWPRGAPFRPPKTSWTRH